MPLGTHKATLFGVAGVSTEGDVVLLSTQTASGSASLDFTLPTVYKQVVFGFYNVTPVTDSTSLGFQVNASDDVGGSFNQSYITSASFYAHNPETGSPPANGLLYNDTSDQAQGTAFQGISVNTGNDADHCLAGELQVFSNTSTTYVKHFLSRVTCTHPSDYEFDSFVGGYINQPLALSEISFKMSSGNISSGTIKMWGVKN